MTEAILGIAVASELITAAVFEPESEDVSAPRRPAQQRLPSPGDVETVLTGIAQQVDAFSGGEVELRGVGISLGGHVDHARGHVIFAHDLVVQGKHWTDVDLAKIVGDRLGLPVAIDNDANCMAEYYKSRDPAGSSGSSFVLVYIAPDGIGVGSAIVMDGRTVRGASGGAGEVGHIVVQPGGPRCNCGNRGCLQALVSGATLRRHIAWGARAKVHTLADAAQLVEDGDARAAKAFTLAGRSFGQGLAAIVNLVNPPRLLLGGAAEYLLPEAPTGTSSGLFRAGYEDSLSAYTFSCLDEACEIEVVELDQGVAAYGAAQLAAISLLGWTARAP